MKKSATLPDSYTQSSLRLLESRFFKIDRSGKPKETPKDLFTRVSKWVASADKNYRKEKTALNKTQKEFFNILYNLNFIPNSPTLLNAGKKNKTLSGCFVLPIEDSLDGIYKTLSNAVQIQWKGGGTGFNFSAIRPRGDKAGGIPDVAAGPIHFIKTFSEALMGIRQSGKRGGANMAILDVDHPDILEFIHMKERDRTIMNFNISVGITDKFMEALRNDEEYELINPRNGKSVKKLSARYVFNEIVELAHKTGDPGIAFIDNIESDNPTPKLGTLNATNPCITGDALISTSQGLVRFDDLQKNLRRASVLVDNRISQKESSFNEISKIISSGKKRVLKLITKEGFELSLTPDHKIATPSGWTKAQDLRKDQKILIQSNKGQFSRKKEIPFKAKNRFKGENGKETVLSLPSKWSRELGLVLGWLIGDGWLRTGDKNVRVGFSFGSKDKEVLNLLKKILNKYYRKDIKEVERTKTVKHLSYHSKNFADFFTQLGVKSVKAAEKRVPHTIFTAPKQVVEGFLKALFTADGTANIVEGKSAYVRLSSKSELLLKDVQLLLLHFNIFSRIYARHRDERKVFSYSNKNGETKKYTSDGILFELEISKDSLSKFLEKIGFIGKRHDKKVSILKRKNYYKNKFVARVDRLEKVGVKKVFDLSEPLTNSFIANGIVCHNCGEQPLLPYESCNLGALNLRTHFDFRKKDIDWKKLKATINTAVHFLDNVIDINYYPLKEIEKLSRDTNRKIGLGLMGFADVLAMKELPYASEEAVNYAKKLMSFIQKEGIQASVNLAKERGTFAAYKGSTWEKRKLPVRNATITTLAPNGNTSIIGGTTGGIEPIYSHVYKIGAVEDKNYRATQVLLNVNQAFEYLAKKYKFASKDLYDKLAEGKSVSELEEIPEKLRFVLKTAHEIDPMWHLRMQAAFQKHVDNAISKTINFPNEATVDDIRKIFIEAYKNKVKGVTIFRDGCKDAQTYVASKSSKLNVKETRKKEQKQKLDILVASKNKKKVKEIKEYIKTHQKSFNISRQRFSLKEDDKLKKKTTDKKLLEEASEKARRIGEEEQVITIADETGFILRRIRLPKSSVDIDYYSKNGKYTKKLFDHLLDHMSTKGSKAYISTALAVYDPFKDKLITTTTKIPGKLVTQKRSKYKMLFLHEGLDSFKTAPKREEFNSFHHRYTALNKIFDKFSNYKEEKIDINLSKNAYQVLEKRSLLKNSKGKVTETPSQLFHRITDFIIKASKKYNYTESVIEDKKQKFFEALKNLEFLCGGAFIWAGMSDNKGKKAIWSKCFVLPMEDSIDGIFSSLNDNIDILRNGGGTGFNFSNIRSTYATVKVTGEHAAGPVEYLKVYNRAQDTIIGRGGRKMGSMAILDIDHPNIEEFIAAKDEPRELPNYNISIGITDEFMEAVKDDKDWELIDPHDRKVYKKIKARKLFDLISKNAWQSGDPGVVFLDYLDNGNPTPHLGTINATNVCGEQPLLAYESCNLGNINLSKIVTNFPYLEDTTFAKKRLGEKLKYINWDRFEELIGIGIEFLDNVIDVNNYPIKEIEQMTKKTRSIGLGLMGFADLLVKLGIPYDSKDAVKVAEKLMKFLRDKSYEASKKLGKERGNFPAFKGSIWEKKTKFMRNARCTTIAPTGTISIIGDCNPGIEPIFALSFKRKNSLGGTEQVVVENLFEKVAKRRAFYSRDLMEKIASGKSLAEIDSVPADIKEIFKTSHEIEPTQHIKIQAAFQKYCDSGVSKTINLPNNATVEDVKDIYKLAYKLKCKGITIFRDGCKEAAQQAGTKKDKPQKTKALEKPRERPDMTRGTTTKVKTEQGSLYVTINEDDIGIAEVFLSIGKSGGYTAGYCEAIGRLLSVSLRAGISFDVIIHHLKGIRTSTPILNKGMFVYSVPDAVAKVLEQYKKRKEGEISMLKETQKVEMKSEEELTADSQQHTDDKDTDNTRQEEKRQTTEKSLTSSHQPTQPKAGPPRTETDNHQPSTGQDDMSEKEDKETEEDSHYSTKNHYDMLPECPDCGGDLVYAEGCMMCQGCGYSKCG